MRRHLIGSLLVCLFSAAAFATQFSAKAIGLRVNEAAARFSLQKEGAVVTLALENAGVDPLPARIKLELVDPRNAVRALATREISAPSGASVQTINLVKTGAGDYDQKELLWYRLRYEISSGDPTGSDSAPVSGLISLSGITPDIFKLLVSAPQEAGREASYTIRVRAMHPLTGAPITGVNLEAQLLYEEANRERFLMSTGLTDSIGEALMEFKLPGPLRADEVKIQVAAWSGGFSQKAEEDVSLLYPNRILVSTDKPLYQPGQTLHMRVLGLDRDRKAWANVDGTLKIQDPEGSYIFRAGFTTSRFGVANVDWPISDGARLGEYFIEAWMGEEGPRNAPGGQRFKISRYDLPNFIVNVKPDRGFYLPGQNAEVEIRADYLFGRPVKRGRARVVRETERRWDYRQQRWETEEGEKYEGELDDEGRFIARVNLAEAHKEFGSTEYSKFRDLRYAAYLTDLTTGRAEQRRFDLRITREPIHVYLIERGGFGEGGPLQFYVSTFYPDGNPAECAVSIRRTSEDDGGDKDEVAAGPRRKSESGHASEPLITVKTNRYGVAKATLARVEKNETSNALRLEVSASDNRGGFGGEVHTFWDRRADTALVETNKTLYRAGEPIRARLTTNTRRENWIVDLMRGSRLLATQPVHPKDGRAEIAFPFNPEFDGELTIFAYPASGEGLEDWPMAGVARILYPRDRELKLDVTLDHATYRPGDEARADLRMRTPQGRAVEGALGAVIFDKAVEERARTGQEFSGSGFGFYDGFRELLGETAGIAGVTRHDLDRLDLSKPLPEGMELVAEVLLNQRDYDSFRPRLFSAEEFTTDAESVFGSAIGAQLKPADGALVSHYAMKSIYPIDETTLQRQMLLAGIGLNELRDPWGTAYRPRFSVESVNDVFELISAGPDKRFDTNDDIVALRKTWPYFSRASAAIGRAADAYHAQTGGFIRDRDTLKRELLAREAVDLDAMRDRWGNPYRFEFGVEQRNFSIRVISGGPNGRFEDLEGARSRRVASDDFTVSTWLIDYAAETRARINLALTTYFNKTKLVPPDTPALREALKQSGVDFDELRDGWGNRYYAIFKITSRYSDRVTLVDQARFGEQPKPKTEITPVTQQLTKIIVRSGGADGKEGTRDDFDVAEYSQITIEESAKQSVEKIIWPAKSKAVNYSGVGGSVAGVVTDLQGAGIPDVTVTAKHAGDGSVWTMKTNEDGAYWLHDLAPGAYELRFEASGFKIMTISDVAVSPGLLTKVDATLNVGSVSETVAITAGPSLQLSTKSTAVAVTRGQVQDLVGGKNLQQLKDRSSAAIEQEMSTPRLREYFPETLLWRPQIETDKQGRAQLKFKLADNITTWKLSVVGSTLDGEIGIVEKEFRAFQPFFAEHDPPKALTEGDEVSLPVVLRNYLDKPQSVSAEIKSENWFELLGSGRKRADVKAGDAGQVTFDFRATASVKGGRQRVTVFGSDARDAVERPVNVHPDGEELARTAGEVFASEGTLEINVPGNAIKGSARAELKIYPNLMAHAMEGVEGILQRPYGCGEQTISSAYPNLMILRYLEPQSETLSAPLRKVREKALRYAQAGYERLLGYRAIGGGFSYWGHGGADLALTAYALGFLNDAKDFVDVDEDVVEAALKYIFGQQQPDGRWVAGFAGKKEDTKRTALNTAFIARVLAAEKTDAGDDKAFNNALARALDYLAKRADEIDEPYLIASYALAAIDAGEKVGGERALARLRTLARDEAGTTFWNLESNTPFYGWGMAGRVETTALAVRALKRGGATGRRRDGAADESLINRGLLFLLRNKDRYGVWHSTQATINTLDTLIELNETEGSQSDTAGAAEILVNGKPASSIPMPPSGQLSNPITFDLSSFLSQGNNRVVIRRPGKTARASAQVVESHYEPWAQDAAERRENALLRNSSALRLRVNYDRSEAKVGGVVTCDVIAERGGYGRSEGQSFGQNFGMMLAEIGLPPGADVDRESLEHAARETGGDLNHYDVLPDRVIVYLWPRAGGVKFSFKFKPRYGIRAQSAPSALYDYYNPEARVVIAPTRFVVR
jgi:hypothetical protein